MKIYLVKEKLLPQNQQYLQIERKKKSCINQSTGRDTESK